MKLQSVLKCFKRKNTIVPASNVNSLNLNVDKLTNNWVNNNELEHNNNECIICLDNTDDLDLTLPCMHRFHKKCVNNWYQQSNNLWCPVCKYPFKKKLIRDFDENTLRYNNETINSNSPRRLTLNSTNQVIVLPSAPSNTPPRIARFRNFRSRLNRINVNN